MPRSASKNSAPVKRAPVVRKDVTATNAQFDRAFAKVLRRYGSAFKALADHDAGRAFATSPA